MGTGGRRKARLWSFSCCPLGLCTSPYPCISEMLIQGHVPEELSAKSGPACSGRMSRLICKEAISSPQGNGSAFRLKSSLQFCARSSLRRQSCSHPGRGCWFTWEPAPETVGKTEMQGFLRRKRRILTSYHSWAWPWVFCLQYFQRMMHPPVSRLHPAELHLGQPGPLGKWLGPHNLWSSG